MCQFFYQTNIMESHADTNFPLDTSVAVTFLESNDKTPKCCGRCLVVPTVSKWPLWLCGEELTSVKVEQGGNTADQPQIAN
jgi:hypothetical protein